MKNNTIITTSLIIFLALTACGQTNETQTIGLSAPLSGPLAIYGQWSVEGAELAIQDLNDQGKQFQLLVEDDQCSPKHAAQTIHSLLPRADGLIVTCSAAVPGAATQTKEVILSPSAVSAVAQSYTNVYSLEQSMAEEMQVLANHIQSKGITSMSILYVTNDLGETYKNEFITAFTKGGTITAIESFGLPDNDYRTQLTKIKDSNSQGLLIIMGGPKTATIVKQIDELQLDMDLFGTTVIEAQPLITIAGALAEGIEYAYPYKPTSHTFTSQYTAVYQRPPERMAAFTYDAVIAWAYVLEECKSDTACQHRVLNNLALEGAAGSIEFNKDGDAIRETIIKTVKNGKFELLK
jgi:branched-chain amino acid transport system substrate-binding protein